LMVRGVTPELLFGRAAAASREREEGEAPQAPETHDTRALGWSGLITVDSAVDDTDARGETRVNIKSAGEEAWSAVPGISAQLAKDIVAYRNLRPFERLADVLNVAPVRRRS